MTNPVKRELNKKIFRFFGNGIFLILLLSILGNCMGASLFSPGGRVRSPGIYDSATIIRTSGYDILEESIGESSTFFVFGMIPITNPISIDYALSQAVQKVPGGRSIVNIKVWHETHVMFPLGTVSVLKVKGNVIGNREEAEKLKLEQQRKDAEAAKNPAAESNSAPSEGISVGGNKSSDSSRESGGISVGGKKSSKSSSQESGGISVGGKKN
ncbi:hypothetical protein [Leptospira adleri]|uniref:Uncharacterized protein n=1 Tax=Leptospira adleri TaxID=2023186 RepID=A0A2M9YLM7_9LEPT|nr:hypothetical protein [Leptospira adleri]PJZ52439.1 hypothetical protein CH380_14820 [Leptospira adleri]PJZ63612.1 hypothetical protein CH376_01840 [Leptospira adleri]